jgi:death-on-curing protein
MAFTLTLKPEVEQRLRELAEAERRSMHKTVEVAIEDYLARAAHRAEVRAMARRVYEEDAEFLAEHTGSNTRVRDPGILCAAAARMQARILGESIYPTPLDQAGALLHAIVCWRPLDLWNAGLGWAAVRVHLGLRGLALAMPAKERMALTDALASGELDAVDEVALRLSPYLEMLD